MRAEEISLRWPAGGVHKRAAYQNQPPYTTPDALNVRPDDVQEGRERGGTRPGLFRPFPQMAQLGTSAYRSIRMLNTCSVINSDALAYWQDNFESPRAATVGSMYGLGRQWSSYGDMWFNDSDDHFLQLLEGEGVTQYDTSEASGAAMTRFDVTPDIDTSQAYAVSILVGPHGGATTPQAFAYLYVLCDDGFGSETDTTTQNGVEIRMNYGDEYADTSCKIEERREGEDDVNATYTSGASSGDDLGWLTAVINGTNIKVYWNGSEITTGGGFTLTHAAQGYRVGFGLHSSGDEAAVYSFLVQYRSSSGGGGEKEKRVLLASTYTTTPAAGGGLYEHDMTVNGSWSHVNSGAGDPQLVIDRQVLSAEHNGKLYIADWEETKVSGTDGEITNDGGTYKLTATGVSNWTTVANDFGTTIDANDDFVIITNGLGAIVNGSYEIESLAAGYLELPSTVGEGSGCSYKVCRAPKVYDPAEQELTIWNTETYGANEAGGESGTQKGTMPSNCNIIARYRDRIFLAGDPDNPHIYYSSRRGNPLDFHTGLPYTDADRAYAGQPGSSGTEAGSVSQAITALIPMTDDYLLIACANSLHILRGDAAYGGIIDNVSSVIGIPHRTGWCRTPEGGLLFLSYDGLYYLPPGAAQFPQPVSKDRLPRDLRNLNMAWGNTYSMSYDVVNNGVWIFQAMADEASRTLWWLDWQNKGFWPNEVPDDYEATACCVAVGQSSQTHLLWGCRDGYIREFRREAYSDEGTNFASHVVLGPVLIGGDWSEGMLEAMSATLPPNSSDGIDWVLVVADTAEQAVRFVGTGDFNGSFVAGRNYDTAIMKAGKAFGLYLQHNGGAPWCLDNVTVRRRLLRRYKKV